MPSAMFGESPAWEESRQEEITLVEEEACQAVFYDFLRLVLGLLILFNVLQFIFISL